MKRLFSMTVIVSLFMGGLITVSEVLAKEDQGIPQQLQILNGKIDQIQQTLTVIQNSVSSGGGWYQLLPSAQRFLLVMGDQAVLDLETGLVWERKPQNPNGAPDFVTSVQYCSNLDLGGRKGWHLPTIGQLTSLVDTSVASTVKLPNGHPFLNVSADGFYFALPPGFSWGVVSVGLVFFGTGQATISFSPGCTDGGCGSEHQWCVRSGY